MGRRKLLLGLYRATPVKRPRKHRVRETPIETDRCVSAVLRGNATHVKPSWLDGRYRRRAFRTVRRLDRKRERKTSRQRSINGTRFGQTRFNRFRRNAFRARKRRRRNERFYFGRTLIGFISISRKTVPDSAPFSPSSRTYRRFLYSILHAFFFFLHFLVRLTFTTLWHEDSFTGYRFDPHNRVVRKRTKRVQQRLPEIVYRLRFSKCVQTEKPYIDYTGTRARFRFRPPFCVDRR